LSRPPPGHTYCQVCGAAHQGNPLCPQCGSCIQDQLQVSDLRNPQRRQIVESIFRGELQSCTACGEPHAGYHPGVTAYCDRCGDSLAKQLEQLRFVRQMRQGRSPQPQPSLPEPPPAQTVHTEVPPQLEPQASESPGTSAHCKVCGATVDEQVDEQGYIGAAAASARHIAAAAAAIQSLPQPHRAGVAVGASSALCKFSTAERLPDTREILAFMEASSTRLAPPGVVAVMREWNHLATGAKGSGKNKPTRAAPYEAGEGPREQLTAAVGARAACASDPRDGSDDGKAANPQSEHSLDM
jgi:hypothetical protein